MTTFADVLFGPISQIPKSQRYSLQVFLRTAAVVVIFAPFITLSACSAEADISRDTFSNYLLRNETNHTQDSQPKPRTTVSSSSKLTVIGTDHVQVNASLASVDGVPSISFGIGSSETGKVTYDNISVTAENTSTSNSSVNSTSEITKKMSNERSKENIGKENGHDVFSFLTATHTEILSGIPYTNLNHENNGQLEKTESSTLTQEQAFNRSVAIKDRVNGNPTVVPTLSVTMSPDREESGSDGTSPLGSGYAKNSFHTSALYEGNTPYRLTSHQTTSDSMQLSIDELVTDLYRNPISSTTNAHTIKQKVETSQVATSTLSTEQNSTSQTVNKQDNVTTSECPECRETVQEKVYPNESFDTTASVKEENETTSEFLKVQDTSLRAGNRTLLPLNRTSESFRVPTSTNSTPKYAVISKRTSNLTAVIKALSSANVSNGRAKTTDVTTKPVVVVSTKILHRNDTVKPTDFSRNFTVLHKNYSIQEEIPYKHSESKALDNSSKEVQLNITMEQLTEFTKTGHSTNSESQMMNADLHETTPSAVAQQLLYAHSNLSSRHSALDRTEPDTDKESTTPSGVNGLYNNELPKYTDNNVFAHAEFLQGRQNFSQSTKSQEEVQKSINLIENILVSTVESNPLGDKSQPGSLSAEQPNTYVSKEFLHEKGKTSFGKRDDKDPSLFIETTTNTNDLLKSSTVLGMLPFSKNFTSNMMKTASSAEFYSYNESHVLPESENETTQTETDLSVSSRLPEKIVDLEIHQKDVIPVSTGGNVSHPRSTVKYVKYSIFPEKKSEIFFLSPDTQPLSYNQTTSSRTIVPKRLVPVKAGRQGNNNTEASERSKKSDVLQDQELFLTADNASSVSENASSVWYSDSKHRQNIETRKNVRNTSAAKPNGGDTVHSSKRSGVTVATLVDNEIFSDSFYVTSNRSRRITTRYTSGDSSTPISTKTPEYSAAHVSVSEGVHLPFIKTEIAHAQEKRAFYVPETTRQKNQTARRNTLMRSTTLSTEGMKRSFPQSNAPDRTTSSITHEIEKNQTTGNELAKESQKEKNSTIYPKYNDHDCDPKVSKCALHSAPEFELLEDSDVSNQKHFTSSAPPGRVYSISYRSGKATASSLINPLSVSGDVGTDQAVTSTTRHDSVKYDQFSIEIQSQQHTRNGNRAESDFGKIEQVMGRDDETSQSFSSLLQPVTFSLPRSVSKVNFGSTPSNDEIKRAAANDTYPENMYVETVKTAIKSAGSSGSRQFNEKNLDVEKFSTEARLETESSDVTQTPTTVTDASVVSHVIKQTTFFWQKYVHSYAKGSKAPVGGWTTLASNVNHLSTKSIRRPTAALYSQLVGHSERGAESSDSEINTPYDGQKRRKSEAIGLVKESSQSDRQHETILCQCKKCMIPASDSCVAYYKCKHGKPKRKTCSHGKLFDLHKLKCVRAYKANCSLQEVSSPRSEVQAYDSIRKGKCAKGNNCADDYQVRLEGKKYSSNTRMKEKEYEHEETAFCSCRKCLLPSRGSCSTYYKCKHGKPKKKRCSRGKLFDYRSRKCVWAHKASCLYRKFLPRL